MNSQNGNTFESVLINTLKFTSRENNFVLCQTFSLKLDVSNATGQIVSTSEAMIHACNMCKNITLTALVGR